MTGAADATTNQPLEGKVALITGASQGLGRRFADVLSGAGAAVGLVARTASKLDRAAREIDAAGGRVAVASADVRDPVAVAEAVASIEETLGGIDILVNNSGIAHTSRLLETTPEDWASVVDTNLTGAWLMAQAVSRSMVDGGRPGSIVNISSLLGQRTQPGVASYAAAKGGLDQLTRQMAMELARKGIRVNALAPGYVLTDINRDFFDTPAGEALIRRVPMGRIGDPTDLDGPLLFLASDASAYVTGTVIAVDGGHMVAPL